MAYPVRFNDVIATIEGGGADDGAFTGTGAPITVCLDELTIDNQNTLADLSCGQTAMEWHRKRKQSFDLSFKFRVESDSFDTGKLAKCIWDNDLFRVIATVYSGRTLTYIGVIEGAPISSDDGLTMTVKLKPYGVLPVLA